MHLTCCLLPKAHRDSLEVLFSFLTWAASFSQVDEETGSKMDAHNLATVVAPNILYANAPDGLTDESFFAIEAVHMLLEYNDQLCEVRPPLPPLLIPFSPSKPRIRLTCSIGARGHPVRAQRHRALQQHARDHH